MGTLISLVLLVVAGWAGFHVLPVYIADYTLQDTMIQVARRPVYLKEAQLVDMLMEEVKAQRLQDNITRSSWKINTRDGARKIEVAYKRTVEILPSWVHTFEFKHVVDERYF